MREVLPAGSVLIMEYQNQNKTCQNCTNDFVIESDDFNFYEKIKVPPPTFCVECRMQRRLAFRNTHSLYKRKDSFSGKDIISIYSADKDLVVIDQKTWWGDSWDAMDYAQDYDFSKPFFQQWKELRDEFPLMSLSNSKAVNSDYCNVSGESKDSYLCSASWKVERCMYCDGVSELKDCIDLHVVFNSEYCYEDLVCSDSYKLFYSQDCNSCVDSYFLYDCKGCTSCFMSSNLRNKSYVMFNQQLSKEEYQKKIKEFDLGSHEVIQNFKKDFENMKFKAIHRFSHIINAQDVTGNNIKNSKNCKNCFDVFEGLEDSKNVFWGGIKSKEIFDSGPGLGMGEMMYEVFDTGIGAYRNLFTSVVYESQEVEYSFNCYNSSYVFGCIGLRNKKYCILNKQYSKEEYFEMVEKIKTHMMDMPYIDKRGLVYGYGEFFPIELSPFSYNETVAQDFFPLEKEKAIELKYLWKDREDKNYKITIKNELLIDNIKDVSDSILNEIIECEHKGMCKDRCTTAFKIIPNELLFYKRFGVPLPRLCYGCRHQERFAKRNPMKLWHRQCMCKLENHNNHSGRCPVEFETSYSPDRTEIIYCEKCYQQEVY